MDNAQPEHVHRKVKLHVYAAGTDGAAPDPMGLDCWVDRVPLAGEVSDEPTQGAASSLNAGLQSIHAPDPPAPPTHGTASNLSSGLDARDAQSPPRHGPDGDAFLQVELKKHGYDIPDAHLQVFMDWAYTRTLQIGIRRPFKEDQRRLLSDKGHTKFVQAMAGDVANRPTLILSRLLECAARFIDTFKRFNKICEDDAAHPDRYARQSVDIAATRFRLIETRQWKAYSNGKETAEQGLHDAKFESRDKVRQRLVDLARSLRIAIRHAGESDADNKGIAQVLVDLVHLIGDPDLPQNYTPASDLSGCKVVWSAIDLYDSEQFGSLQTKLKLPHALVLSDGSLQPFANMPDDFAFADGITSLCEGYHLFRVVPDIHETVSALADHSDPQKNHKAAKLNALANDRLIQQFKRDRSLLAIDMRTALQTDAAEPLKGQFFAPFMPGVNDHASQSDPSTALGETFSHVQDGALLITIGDHATWHFHVLANQNELSAARANLLANQSEHKTHNLIPLSTISFIAGRLYGDPTGDMFRVKMASKLVRNFHWKAKGALLAGTTIGMFILSTAGVGAVVLPIVGLGFMAFKRITTNAFIINPERALKGKDFTKTYIFDEPPNRSAQEYMNDYFNFPNSQAKKVSITDAELEEMQSKALADYGEANAEEATDAQKATAKRIQKQREEDADKLITGDAGDILRRSFVHFLRASKALTPKKDETDAQRDQRHGEALHHIEKGWRYMGPAIYYLGIAWTEYKTARALWQVQSPQTSKVLLDEFDRLGVTRDPEALEAALRRTLRPAAHKRFYYHVKRITLGVVTRTRPNKIELKETNARVIFDQQLAEFKRNAFGEQGATPNLDAELIAEVGGPELYAEWQLRGGRLEPYKRFTTAETSASHPAKRRAHIDLGGQPKHETHALVDADIKVLSEVVGFRMDLYHTLLPASPKDALYSDEVQNLTQQASVFIDLSNAMVANDRRVEKAWRKADKWTVGKAFLHVGRNWKDKRTPGEIIKSVIGTFGEFVGGTWVSFGFGAFFERMKFVPEPDGLMFRVLDVPEVDDKNIPDITKQRLAEIKKQEDKKQLTERVNRAANKVSFAAAFGTAKFMMNLTSDQVMGKTRGDAYKDSQFLGTRTTAAKARAKSIATFLQTLPDAPAPEPQPEIDAVADSASLKRGAAYVGENLTKRIGAGMILMADYREGLLGITAERLKDQKTGLTDKTWTLDDNVKPLDELISKIALLSEYYSVMSSLEADYIACQAYMNMLGYVGCQIEDSLFEQMGMTGGYSMRRVDAEVDQ